jgi:transposase
VCWRTSCAKATYVGAHRTDEAQRRRDGWCNGLYLPPYSPEMNPIELCWSKLKGLLREFAARTRDALDEAIRRAMDLIDKHDATAWFKHCGYQVE